MADGQETEAATQRPEARLGSALRLAREERGISLRALAARLYRSHSNLVEYERGHRLAPLEIARAYETHLGLTPGSLVALHEQARSELYSEERSRRPTYLRLPPQVALHQLPADVAGFIGRESQLDQLRAVIGDYTGREGVPVVISAIAGMAGVGKSALALHLAHELAPRFPDAQLYVDLYGYEPHQRLSPAQVLDRFLRALGMADEVLPTGVEEQASRYRALLADKRALVLLDNASSAEQVRPLLPGSSSCVVLITSRDRLAGLVATEGARLLSLDVLAPEEAVDLLARVAGRDRVLAEPKEADEVARLCGYLPLAVRIAAARLATRPAMRIFQLAELLASKQRLSELTAGDRQVRASFSLSYEDLDRAAARMFRFLGLVPGPDFGPGVAAELAATSLEEAEGLLETLVDVHLVEAATDQGRYRFHDLLRLYARERVEAEESDDNREAALQRVLEWYLRTADAADRLLAPARRHLPRSALAERPKPLFASPPQALAWFEAERASLVAATHQAAECGFHVIAWQLPDALWMCLIYRPRWIDWRDIQEAGVAAARKAHDRRAEAWMLTSLATPLRGRRRFDEAAHCLQRSLEICQELDDRPTESRALRHLGLIYSDQGKPNEAVEYLQRSVAMSREIGDRAGEGTALEWLGNAYRRLGQLGQAMESHKQVHTIFHELGDRRGESKLQLGEVYLDMRRYEEAIDCFTQARAIGREFGDRLHEAWALTSLGLALQQTGKSDASRACWEEALAIFTLFGEFGAPMVEEVRSHLQGRVPNV
jgi:tetratricopeptide (TPR) repeat protein/transcriptional regulator with XRE-family HTH domain